MSYIKLIIMKRGFHLEASFLD